MNNNNDLSRHSSATAGDSVRSFESDVLPVAGDLYRRALAYTKNDAHADDLVQETLLKAYKAFDKLRLETHLRASLLCIMRNTWINNYRADLRRPVETLVGDIADGQLDSVVPHGSGHVLSAEHQALRHMLDPELAAALLTLSEDMRETVYYVAVLGMKCREEAELMGVPAGTPYREYTASGPTCAGHWAWMRATLTAPICLEPLNRCTRHPRRRDMNYPIQGGNPLQDSAREWQKIQVGVLGFVGICGLLSGGKTTSRPSWVQDLSAFSALSGLVLALLAVLLIASVAHPLTPRPISALTASRRLTGGIIVTFVAVGLTALAALSWWWPQGDRTAPSAPQLAVTTSAGSACGTLLQSGAGEMDLEIDGKTVRVPLSRLKSIEFADNC